MTGHSTDQKLDTFDDLIQSLKATPASSLNDFFTRHQDCLTRVLSDPSHFSHTLQAMPNNSIEKCNAIYEAVKNYLSLNVQDENDLNLIFIVLPRKNKIPFCLLLYKNRPEIFSNITCFKTLFKTLPHDNQDRKKIYDSTKNRLVSAIFSAEDLGNILCALSPEECTDFCNIFKEKLMDIIFNASFFANFFRILSDEQRALAYEAIKDSLPDLIETAEDFYHVSYFLSTEQRLYIYESIKKDLNEIIINKKHLINIFTALPPEKYQEVCNILNTPTNLEKFIKNEKDLNDLIVPLLPEQCATVFYLLKDRLGELIKTEEEIVGLLTELPLKICIIVLEKIENNLKNIALKKFSNNPINKENDDKFYKLFVIFSLKAYCDRIKKTKQTTSGEYIDFRLFAASRSRSRDINHDLAEKLIASLESGEKLETVFSEKSIHEKRDAIRKEKFKNHQGPFERKAVWSAELNKIFQTTRAYSGKPASTDWIASPLRGSQ